MLSFDDDAVNNVSGLFLISDPVVSKTWGLAWGNDGEQTESLDSSL